MTGSQWDQDIDYIIFPEEEIDWGLQSVLTHYYDMKSVRPEE